MIHKYRDKHKLTKDDQAEYFFESMFILFIQLTMCICIFIYQFTDPDANVAKYRNEWLLQLCIFFTNLVLHFSCVSTIRNGIFMMKFVVRHADQFGNPAAAFFFGFMIFAVNILAAFTNAYMTMTRKDVLDVINKFVGFKLLIQIQQYYLRSKIEFPIRDSVKEPLEMDMS